MDFQVVTAAAACCGSVALGGVLHRLKPLANSDAAGMRNGRRAGLRLALLLACLAGLVGTTAGRWPPLAVTVLALPVLVAGAFRTRRVIAECARVRPARADLPARESPSRSRVELCPACQGTGRKKAIGRRQRDCGRCNGSGLSPDMSREQILKLAGICPACGGKGSYWLDGGVRPRDSDMPKLEACGACKG
jgi:hypothetical protein